MGSSDSLSCECGQVLFDVANRKPGETLTCPWCSKEYRYLGGAKVERVNAPKSKTPDKEPKPKASAPKDSARKESRRKESAGKPAEDNDAEIAQEGEEEVFTFESADSETVKMKSFAARRKPGSPKPSSEDSDETPAPKKKGGGLGDAPGGVLPMVGFMAGFSLLAFMALGAIFPETPQHRRQTPWGEILKLKSPWPELIAMIVGQVTGFVAWGFYVYRLHMRQKAEAAANPEPEKKLDKSTMGSSKKISIRKTSTSKRETKRERRKDDSDEDDDDVDGDEDDDHVSDR